MPASVGPKYFWYREVRGLTLSRVQKRSLTFGRQHNGKGSQAPGSGYMGHTYLGVGQRSTTTYPLVPKNLAVIASECVGQ